MSNEPGILPKPVPFGKYYLLERINVGGMAEVYKAKAFGVEGFERLLAVKKILASIAEDESFINMFIDEAKIAGQLSHPNIAQIFDLGKVDGSYFIAMEYISGKDVKTIFERARRIGEKVDIPRVCYIVMKVCEGLANAHEKNDSQGNPLNIVHRDISPQNVLISYEGEVKVIDFGIAKATGKQSQTQVGILKGKFSYMSPEQVRGLHVDHRSDLFSLGILLYEMLTLERLFLGDSDFDTLEKIRKVEMSPPSLYNPHIPKELEDIVLRALSKSPDDRFQSAHELAEALERFMRNQGYYFTNKDLAGSMKEAFNADIEFENKKLEYYRDLDLKAPTDDGQTRLEMPGSEQADDGLAWGEEEMETQIFDRESGAAEAITESQIVYAEDADIVEIAEVDDDDDTIEYDRWNVQQQFDQRDFGADAPGAPATGEPDDPGFSDPGFSDPGFADGEFGGDAAGDADRRRPTGQLPAVAEQRREPRRTVQTKSPMADDSGRNPAIVIVVAAAAVVAVGLGVYFGWIVSDTAPMKFETEPSRVDIFFNGQKIHSGPTPFTYQAPLGPAKIRIEHDGYKTHVKNQDINAGHDYTFKQVLKPASPTSGSIFVSTQPPDATVKINGDAQQASTPLTVDELDPATYELSVSRDGYFDEARSVDVGEGTKKVAIKLRPKKVSLTIQSEPNRARFTVYAGDDDDPVDQGRTPTTVDDLAADTTYRVVVDKHDYKEWEKTFEPGADKENTLDAQLSPDAKPGPSAPVADRRQRPAPAPDPPAPTPDPKPAPKPAPKPDPSTTSPKAADPKPTGTGTLSIASKPAARVHIDGEDTGRYTPVLNFKIKAGKHTVKLVNTEFGLNKTVYVNVESGQNEKVINR